MPKILTICQRGNVRSVTVATVLKDFYGYQDIIPVGIETTTQDTLDMLSVWANIIMIAGDVNLPCQSWIDHFGDKFIRLDAIGKDVWGKTMHPELVRKVFEAFDMTYQAIAVGPYANLAAYLAAVDAVYARP